MEVSKDPIVTIRRSLLSVPAANLRALEKAPGLPCDGVIYDLEDSVAPDAKAQARDNLVHAFEKATGKTIPFRQERIIRINALTSGFGRQDLDLVMTVVPDAVLVPKVESVSDIAEISEILAASDRARNVAVWAMIETPRGVLNAAAIAEQFSGTGCFVVGLNDLRKETGVLPQPGRAYLVPWLMQVVLAGRAHDVDVIDSVFNDFRDETGFDAECAQGRAMGFSGKMLIHPAQIEPANRHFGPDPQSIAEAQAIVAAFEQPEASGLNVIGIDGKMVERLHLVEAEKLLTKAKIIAERKNAP
jgi:citrate lyase subunit beta / citryl-CoA lyase